MALVISLFPWVSFGVFEGGIQPFYVMVMIIPILLYILSNKPLDVSYSLFALPVFFALVNSFSSEITRFEFMREVAGYFAMAMSFVFFRQYIQLYGFPKKIIFYSFSLSIFVGLLQVVIDKDILEFVVHARTTSERGVTGFTSEPGFYGLHLATMTALLLLASKGETMKILLLAILGLSLSASVVAAYFYFTIVGSVLIAKKMVTVKIALAALIIGFLIYFVFLDGMRFGQIMYLIVSGDLGELYRNDASANSRISQSLTPFILSYYNDFLPATDSVISQIRTISANDSIHFFLSSDNKIGSYLGRFIFHFGFFFLVPLGFLIFYLLIISGIRRIIAISLIALALFPAISPAYPVIVYFFVYFIYSYQQRFCTLKDRINE